MINFIKRGVGLQKIAYWSLILFLLVGCVGQSKSPEGEEVVASPAPGAVPSRIVLPKVIDIDFPNALKSLNSDIFVENIQAKIAIEKEQLKLLEEISSQLNQECEALSECYVDANNSAFVGKIKLNQYANTLKYQYKLSLVTSNQEQISFSWSDVKADVLTVYEKENNYVAMHYFKDISVEKEVLYIDESQKTSKNSLMISLDNNKSEYRLRSNYISTDISGSSNILVKNETLLEENENMYSLNKDYTDVEEGAYVLLASNKENQPSNLLEVFENAQGSFLSFDHKVQGFSYRDLEGDAISASINEVVPSPVNALD